MLADILQELSSDQYPDGIAELVVIALGTNGRHYLCWKTHTGTYRQHRHGLPEQLDNWLFPADGTTRDFSTLQVVLSSDESFWASDKDGQVRSAMSERSRTSIHDRTPHSETAETHAQRKWGVVRELARDPERRRSLTWSSTKRTDKDFAGPTAAALRAGHGRFPSIDSAATNSTARKRRTWMIPPGSDRGGLGVLDEQESSTLPRERSRSARTQDCPGVTCKCIHGQDKSGRLAKDDSAYTGHSDTTKSQARTPRYVDAGVQTEAPKSPSLSPTQGNSNMYEEPDESVLPHDRRRATASWPPLTIDCRVDYSSDQRSSQHRDGSGSRSSSAYGSPVPVPNPIVMGRMQDYFRATTYVLGDALGS